MSKFAVLIATVAAFQSVAEGAAHLLSDLHTRLETATQNDDMDEVRDIVASLNASKDELAAAVVANTPAAGADTITGGDSGSGSTLTGGAGDDSLGGAGGTDTLNSGGSSETNTLVGGQGDDTVQGGQGGDAVVEAAPVAVVSTDPAIVSQAPSDSGAGAVIVTDHPTDGTVLVTPVTGGDHEDLQAGDVTVDPTTGVPTVDPDAGVTLGETIVAGAPPSTAAELATANPDAVVSATGGDVQDA